MLGFARHVAVFDAISCVSRSLGETVFVKYQGPGLIARGLKHPLVDGCVGNDVSLAPGAPNIVLTGANASGKSTVLRSVALASVMSRTVVVAYCDAIAVKPVRNVFTHMCVPDDVLEGKSRFQAEMSSIGDIVTNVLTGSPCSSTTLLVAGMWRHWIGRFSGEVS
jgi:DNA mismatch repair ATPase MutS